MAQEPLNRPPNPDDPMFPQWMYQLWKRVQVAGQIAWTQITGTPTTFSGYGITMSTARLLGRTTAGTGTPEEITVGAGLSLSAGSLIATGGGGGSYHIDGGAADSIYTSPQNLNGGGA
jgi:hypothetical protein